MDFNLKLVLILLLACPIAVWGQSQQADSIKKELRFVENGRLVADTATINTLNELGMAYRHANIDSTFKYANIAAQLADEINYTPGRLFANYLKGTAYFYKGQYQRVYEIADTSLQEAGLTKYNRERAYLNQLMGLSYASQGNYQPGLQYFLEARNLFEQLDNDNGVFQNLNNIGVSYLKLEDYEKALEIFHELDSLRTLEPATISIPVNLGFIYYELGQYDKAEHQLMRVLNFEDGSFDRRALGLSNFKLGEIYLAKEEYQDALQYFNRSIEIYIQLDNELEEVQSLNGIAQTYLEMNRVNQALKFADMAYKTAENFDALPERSMSAGTLANVYKAAGNYKNALTYFEIHKSLSDSMHNEDISRKVGRLEAEFEYHEREMKMREAQQRQNLENANRVANRNGYILLALSLFLIASVVAYSQYRNSTLRKKTNDLLRDKNKQIEQQAKRLKEMNEVKTHLFSIIAHDLRGPLSSLNAFITLHEIDELSEDLVKTMIPELTNKFKYTSTLLNNLLNWSKSQLEGYNVNPEKFELSDTIQQTQKLLSQQASDKGIILHNKVTSPLFVYADENMINLVVLNLLSNAIKFTREQGEIIMDAKKESGKVIFSIEDNGVGIPEDKLNELLKNNTFYTTKGTNKEEGTGLGLILCKDFIRNNNGQIWAESEEGKGSTFYFSLPVGV